MILYEMLAGVRPFDAESKVALLGMKVTHDPPSITAKNPRVLVPTAVENLTMKLLEKEASLRYQDAREVIDAIASTHLAEARTELPHRATPLGGPASSRLSLPNARGSMATVPAAETGQSASGAEGATQRGVAFVQSLIQRLPFRLGGVSPAALLVGGALVCMLLGFLLVAALRGPQTRVAEVDAGMAPPPQPFLHKLIAPKNASAEMVATAAAAGPHALEELAAKFPEDAAVWRALVKADTAQKHGADAMQAVTKLVAVSEQAADSDEVEDAVTAAAQGNQEAADAAFALMEGGLGAKGPDLLFGLTTTKQVSARAQARARQSLAKAEVRSKMSPALQVAIELKNAKGCEAKKALLPKAKESGDARTLVVLRPLMDSRGCGFLGLGDCWSCMHRDGSLASTIAGLEDRK